MSVAKRFVRRIGIAGALLLYAAAAVAGANAQTPANAAAPAPSEDPWPYGIYTLSGGKPVELPARFTQHGIVVRVTIDGRGYDFILDTGSSILTIDPGVAHDLGLTSNAKGAMPAPGGTVDVSATVVPTMSVGPLTMHDVPFSVIPVDKVNGGDDHVAGLLGFPFLAGAVVAIDLNAGTVTLYPYSSFDPASVGAVAESPISLDARVPRMSASIESVPGSFLIDTGSFTSVVCRSYLQKLSSVHMSDMTMPEIIGVGGGFSTTVYDVKDLRFGPFHVVNLGVVVSLQPTSLDCDGSLGRNILAYAIIYLDYAEGLIYFKPNLQ